MESSDISGTGDLIVSNTLPTIVETVEAPTYPDGGTYSDVARPLKELRTWRRFSQQNLAVAMGTSQGEISRIEKRKDMHISTLRSYIRAIGGEVVILAKFPNNETMQVTI